MSKLKFMTAVCAVIILTGCIATGDSQDLARDQGQISATRGATIAVLPLNLKTGTMNMDSVGAIRNSINARLTNSVKSKLSGSTIRDISASSIALNNTNNLTTLGNLFETYDSTGVIDGRLASTLSRAASAQYILVSRLSVTKIDMLISKGQATAMESMLINGSNGNVIWSGAGDWKKGGMIGFGGASPDTVADKLVGLTFKSLRQ